MKKCVKEDPMKNVAQNSCHVKSQQKNSASCFPTPRSTPHFPIPTNMAFRGDIPLLAKLIYGVLLRHAKGKGVAWPSLKTLARELSVSLSSAYRGINFLKKNGLISVSKRGQRCFYHFPKGQLDLDLLTPYFPLPEAVAVRDDILNVAKLVYAALLWHAQDKGIAWPSLRTLARETGISQSSAYRAIKCLKRCKLISTFRKGRRCFYRLHALPGKDDSQVGHSQNDYNSQADHSQIDYDHKAPNSLRTAPKANPRHHSQIDYDGQTNHSQNDYKDFVKMTMDHSQIDNDHSQIDKNPSIQNSSKATLEANLQREPSEGIKKERKKRKKEKEKILKLSGNRKAFVSSDKADVSPKADGKISSNKISSNCNFFFNSFFKAIKEISNCNAFKKPNGEIRKPNRETPNCRAFKNLDVGVSNRNAFGQPDRGVSTHSAFKESQEPNRETPNCNAFRKPDVEAPGRNAFKGPDGKTSDLTSLLREAGKLYEKYPGLTFGKDYAKAKRIHARYCESYPFFELPSLGELLKKWLKKRSPLIFSVYVDGCLHNRVEIIRKVEIPNLLESLSSGETGPA